MKRLLLTVLLSSTAIGCASTPPQESGLALRAGYLTSEIRLAIATVRAKVLSAEDTYDSRAKYKHKLQTGFDSTLILLATGTVAAAFFHAPLDLIGGFGIGAGGLSGFRSYYNPESEGAASLKAKIGLGCVYNESEILTRAYPQELEDFIDQIHQAIDGVTSAQLGLGKVPVPASAADAGQQAIEAGRAAIDAINSEIASITQAPQAIDTARLKVIQYVDIKEHRANVDYGQTVQSVSASIDIAESAATKIADARTKLEGAKKSAAQEQGRTGEKGQSPDPTPQSKKEVQTAPQANQTGGAVSTAPVQINNTPPARQPDQSTPQRGATGNQQQARAAAQANQTGGAVSTAPVQINNTPPARQPDQSAPPQRDAAGNQQQERTTDGGQQVAPRRGVTQVLPMIESNATPEEREHVRAVALLVSLTQRALDAIPKPSYSTANTKIAACVSGF